MLPPNGSNNGVKIGIRQRILQAESIPEIDVLLAELGSYDHASHQTKSACQAAAKRRRRELQDASR